MTIASEDPLSSRPFGQTIIIILLFINAFVCIVYSLVIYLAERNGHLDMYVPVALVFSLNPPLALASIASPILILRRSALGLILAWSIAGALILDLLLSLPATFDYIPLVLKMPVDLCLMIGLTIFLIRRVTYDNLNEKSYGFPVLARALGSPPSARPATIPPGQIPQSQAPIAPTPFPTIDPRVAKNIKEAHMQSYIRSANFLRIIALILRILTFIFLVLDAIAILFQLYTLFQPFFRSSAFGSSFNRFAAEMPTYLITGLAMTFLPFVALLLLLVATYILTALAELLRCQASKPA